MRPFLFLKRKGGGLKEAFCRPCEKVGSRAHKDGHMVMFSAVKLKELFEKERNYPWQKPQSCPCCNSNRLWGHGFADAIFDSYKQPLLLKLYRCPECGCVVRLRPEGYFKRFQAPVETIRSSIVCKSTKNRWLGGISRSRQCHWFSALKKRIKAYLADTWSQGMVAGFDYFLQRNQLPVSRSI